MARVAARTEIVVGHHRLGFMPSWICLIVTGGLTIWFSQRAGPWSGTGNQPPATVPR
jgi:hypothetical protein